QAEQKRVAVVGLADQRGQRREAGLARRTPAPLARDQLVAALEPRPQHDGLDDALHADRVGETHRGLVVEPLARLARIRVDVLDGDMRELRLEAAADQHLEAAAETAP